MLLISFQLSRRLFLDVHLVIFLGLFLLVLFFLFLVAPARADGVVLSFPVLLSSLSMLLFLWHCCGMSCGRVCIKLLGRGAPGHMDLQLAEISEISIYIYIIIYWLSVSLLAVTASSWRTPYISTTVAFYFKESCDAWPLNLTQQTCTTNSSQVCGT